MTKPTIWSVLPSATHGRRSGGKTWSSLAPHALAVLDVRPARYSARQLVAIGLAPGLDMDLSEPRASSSRARRMPISLVARCHQRIIGPSRLPSVAVTDETLTNIAARCRSSPAADDPMPNGPTGLHGPTEMPDYKGAPLDADRGPGLGCFWFQVVLLVMLLILTPISVWLSAPSWLSAAVPDHLRLMLLFFVGQTMVFLLRLVAADRRTRRRPVERQRAQTVGQIEDDRPLKPLVAVRRGRHHPRRAADLTSSC